MAADVAAAGLEESAAGHSLKVDGGAVGNDFLCQFQSDLLGMPVVRPAVAETTALGVAFAAGLAVGYWGDLDEVRRLWRADRTFEPALDAARRAKLYEGWQAAVRAALCWAEEAAGRP